MTSRSSDFRSGDIDWRRTPLFSPEERDQLGLIYERGGYLSLALDSRLCSAIVAALKPDFYIEEGEKRFILKQAPVVEKPLVEAVVDELRREPPLFKRTAYVQSLLGKRTRRVGILRLVQDCASVADKARLRQEIENRLKPALRNASGDSNPDVAEKAKSLLEELNKR